MADEIIIKYKADIDGLKTSFNTIKSEVASLQKQNEELQKKLDEAFTKPIPNAKTLQGELKKLKRELANATDPKDIERLAKAAGKLTDQIEDATDAAKVFASESKFEQIGNAFGSVVSKLRNLDFSGAVAQSKLLVSTSKSLTFKEALGGVKDLGVTLANVGKSLLLNPIFLIGAAVTGIIANFDKLKNSGGVVGKVFSVIGDIIGGVKDGLEDFANVIGLVDTQTGIFFDKLIEKSNNIAKNQAETIDRLIKLRQAEGKSTVDLEILKQKQIANTARIEFETLAKKKKATKDESQETKDRLQELLKIQADALYEVDVIETKARADKAKKDAEANKKILEEAKALQKVLRDLTTQNIQGNYAREKQILDDKLADDTEKYKNNEEIKKQLRIKYNNDIKALDKKWYEDYYNELMPKVEQGEKDITQERINATIDANNKILANIDKSDKDRVAKEKETQEAIKQIRMEALNFLSNTINQYAQIYNDNVNAEIQANQDAKDANLESLQEEYDGKLISQEIYEKRKKAIEDEAAQKERELKKEQFERNKQIAIINATIATAQAVVGALAQSKELGAGAFVLAALMGILGAAQVGAITSQPTPKFEKGGWIEGKRHSQGGTIIEAEKDEFVINRKDAMKNASLLEAINSGTAEEFINQKFIAPILREQERKYAEAKDSSFANNIVNSMLLNSGQFKDSNLLESLKRSRQSDRENAIFIVKELTKRTQNSRSW